MVFHRVLDLVFSTWSHVAVLRAIQDSAQGRSGREIARLSSMNHRSCLKALTELEDLRIVERQRGGRDHLFTLNRKHMLVAEAIIPLLRQEREFVGAFEAFLKKQLKRNAVSVFLFGSVARREETAGSDVDVCIIVQSKVGKTTSQDVVHGMAPEALSRFGARLSPVIFTLEEFIRGATKGQSPITDIIRDGRLVCGQSLREVMRG